MMGGGDLLIGLCWVEYCWIFVLFWNSIKFVCDASHKGESWLFQKSWNDTDGPGDRTGLLGAGTHVGNCTCGQGPAPLVWVQGAVLRVQSQHPCQGSQTIRHTQIKECYISITRKVNISITVLFHGIHRWDARHNDMHVMLESGIIWPLWHHEADHVASQRQEFPVDRSLNQNFREWGVNFHPCGFACHGDCELCLSHT